MISNTLLTRSITYGCLVICCSLYAKETVTNMGSNPGSIAIDRSKDSEKIIALAQKNALSNFHNKNYNESLQWSLRYFKEGGSDIQIRKILSQSYFNVADYVNAARELQSEMLIAERNGKNLEEDRLQLLLKAYAALNDNNAQAWVLEKLVSGYPKKSYWSSLLTITQRRPDFRKNLSLDVQRLRLATGTLSEPLDYFEMSQNALNQGFVHEAKLVLDHGIANKILNQNHESSIYVQLRSEINRRIDDEKKAVNKSDAETPSASNALGLFNSGFTLVYMGESDRGLSLMERAIVRVGPTDRPQDAKLHLGIAYLKAGRKNRANEVFNSVSGVHGSADLARLWAIFTKIESN